MNTTNQSEVKGGITMYYKPLVLSYRDEKPTVYKLQVLRGHIITNKNVIAYAAKAAHVPESTVTLAQEALFDAVNYFCMNGHSVQVPGLGSFGIKLNSKTTQTAEEVDVETITRKYIRFYPKASIRDMCSLKNISITVQDLLNLKPKNSTASGGEGGVTP